MARRNDKEEGLADALAIRSWWLSAVLGCSAFAAMRWVLPSLFADTPLLSNLASASRSFAWLALLGFGLVGLISVIRLKMLEDASRTKGRRRSRRSWRDTSINMSKLRFKHGWGVTRQGGAPTIAPKPREVFDSWSVAALRALEWKRFEFLCAKYYEFAGLKSQTIRNGADGSIDIKLFRMDPSQPLAVVQCKSGNVYTIGVKEVRELLALMAQQKTARGIYITTGTFARDTASFVDDHPIQLLDGDGFLRKIQALPKDQQDALFKYVFEGDYRTPTCPTCGMKMTKRAGENGPYWGCLNFPRCKGTFTMKG